MDCCAASSNSSLINEYQAGRIKAGIAAAGAGQLPRAGEHGSGGSSVVFEAEHVLLRRKVAIKVLPVSHDEHPTLLARFLREMRSVARLNHPNIVAAFDAGQLPRRPSGRTGYLLLRHGTIDRQGPGARGRWSSARHRRGMRARSTRSPAPWMRPIAISWCIATSSPPMSSSLRIGKPNCLISAWCGHLRSDAFTTPDVVLGTLEYMAPEQASDATQVDIRTDIFGLGPHSFLP